MNNSYQSKVSIENKHIVVEMVGRVSTDLAESVQEQFDELIGGEQSSILIDCAQLEFLSSSALRVFLQLAKKCVENKKKLVFFSLNNNVERVFNLLGLPEIIDIYSDKAQALAAVS